WSDLFNYWYAYLIIAGLLLLISGFSPGNRIAGSLAGIFITLAIVGGVTRGAHREFRNFSPFEWRQWRNGDHPREERESRKERKRRRSTDTAVKGNYGYDMQPDLRSARLNFSG